MNPYIIRKLGMRFLRNFIREACDLPVRGDNLKYIAFFEAKFWPQISFFFQILSPKIKVVLEKMVITTTGGKIRLKAVVRNDAGVTNNNNSDNPNLI